MIPPLVIANWKMAVNRGSVATFKQQWEGLVRPIEVESVIAPPAIFLPEIADLSGVCLGGQDVSGHPSGAHTGEISAEMLAEYGCAYGIVGHSERRKAWSETNALVAKKAQRLEGVGIRPIICVGESMEIREDGNAERFVANQVLESCRGLSKLPVVAYEPVWAIGSGAAASPEVANKTHEEIRRVLATIFGEGGSTVGSVVYGGSVKASNACDFTDQEHIDGLLVGGASLTAENFWAICLSVEGKS